MTDPRIPSNPYGVLTPLRNCLVGLPEEFSFYDIIWDTKFDPVLAYLEHQRSLEVDWEQTCPAVQEQFVHYEWVTAWHSVSWIN